MYSGSGYESVDTILRRRGFEPRYHASVSKLIVPHLKQLPLTKADALFDLFGHKSFRQFVRKLIEDNHSVVSWEILERVAPGKARRYAQFFADLCLAEMTDSGVRLRVILHNIGPTRVLCG